MRHDQDTVTITLLGKPYQIGCKVSEREELLESARRLNQRMLEIKQSGAVIGLERIAIMAALNIAHELVRAEHSGENSQMTASGIEQLCEKITHSLKNLNPQSGRS
jgi:cell division protein ZapA